MEEGFDAREALKKIKEVDVAQDLSALSANDRAALEHCVAAAKIMNDIYVAQIDPKNAERRAELAARTDDEGKALLDYFNVNGGPWDVFGKDEPFLPGVGERPKAGAFYPADLTEKEWNDWLAAHAGDRDMFEKPTTVIRRGENGSLIAVPYSEAHRALLEKASAELSAAAALLGDGPLKTFLTARAAAFIDNNYWDSDIAWVDTTGEPFDVTIGPYEVYADGLFGVKATYEAFVALLDKQATEDIKKFSEALPEFDAALAQKLGYQPKGNATPMEVVLDVYRGGEGAFGRQFVAFNLPNDRKIHEVKGSKKIFSKTMMEAKFALLGRGVAERILPPDILKFYEFRHRLLFVIGHELAHGIGPGTRVVDGREVSFEVLLKDLHSMLEEAKADMLGAALLDYFHKKGLVTDEELVGCIATEAVAFVQEWRGNLNEAHAAGSLIEYNWMKDRGGIRYDEAAGNFVIDAEKALGGMIALAEEFLKLQLEGDYEKAKAFIGKWGFVAPEIPAIVARMEGLPVEIHATYKI